MSFVETMSISVNSLLLDGTGNDSNTSSSAMELHKRRGEAEQKIWLSRQEHNNVKAELESTLTRLAAVSSRLQQAFSGSLKSNLVDALNGFFQSKILLKRVDHIPSGPLRWLEGCTPASMNNVSESFVYRDSGCIYFEDLVGEVIANKSTLISSVVLSDECKEGFMQGTLHLPKMSTWSISFIITNDSHNNKQGLLSNDYITVRLGSSELTLALIGTFYNRINKETNAVLYEVQYLLRGSNLAYRFEYYSNSDDIRYHL